MSTISFLEAVAQTSDWWNSAVLYLASETSSFSKEPTGNIASGWNCFPDPTLWICRVVNYAISQQDPLHRRRPMSHRLFPPGSFKPTRTSNVRCGPATLSNRMDNPPGTTTTRFRTRLRPTLRTRCESAWLLPWEIRRNKRF